MNWFRKNVNIDTLNGFSERRCWHHFDSLRNNVLLTSSAVVDASFNCHLSWSFADPIFKDLGFRTYAVLLNNRSKQ